MVTPLDDSEVRAKVEDRACPICKGVGYVRADVPYGHPDFGRAIPCSCAEEEAMEQRIHRLQRLSNLGGLTRLAFSDLMPKGRSVEPANQERFQACLAVARDYADNPKGWLVLLGPSGCGKTHMAAAIANHRIALGQPVFFTVVADLLDHLRATFAPGSEISYDELFEHVRTAPLLILDGLGAHATTPWAQEKLYQIINYRFNACLPTVVTTNLSPTSLDDWLRTRLMEPSLTKVCLLEEGRGHGALLRLDALELALVRNMTFDTFNLRLPKLSAEQRDNLAKAYRLARNFAEAPEGWLVFLGGHGCGKTHLAAAIAHHQRKMGHQTIFVGVPDLLDHLRSTFSPDSRVAYDEAFITVKETPLLVLDDLGAQSTTPWAEEKLYQIINYRYNDRKPTVITTSLALDEIAPSLSSRMVDPGVLSTVFHIMAPDYRAEVHFPVMAQPRKPVKRVSRQR